MLDPLVSLALNVQASPGTYALLLGSGVSRSAAIPTGWEVVQDLVRRYAQLAKKDMGSVSPEEWYASEFGAEPSYSALLTELAPTPAERHRVLRTYFEPTDEEREQRLKVPMPAHEEIARLVVGGYVRVIVTTNFDRLVEKAIEAAGIVPTVISSEDQAAGALPLQHSKCTIIKVNGDYLDPRIRNTVEELSGYGPQVSALLDRVLDEFGLIVCGWSAEWDTGLRASLERRTNRRFTTFWTFRGALADPIREFVTRLGGAPVSITDADTFFVNLAEKVESIADLKVPHPIGPQIAVATLKRLLPEPRQEIRLDDLVSSETEALVHTCNSEVFKPYGPVDPAAMAKQMARYEVASTTMLHLLAAGVFFGKPLHDALWVRAITRVAQNDQLNGVEVLLNMRGYPATLLLYGAGIAAVAANRFDTLATLLTGVTARLNNDKEIQFITSAGFTDRRYATGIPTVHERAHTPRSDHLHGLLREVLRRYLPDNEDYEKAFDRFEALVAVLFVYISKRSGFPFGRFVWRNGRGGWTVRDELKDGAVDYWDAMSEDLRVEGGSNQQFFDAAKLVWTKGVVI